MPNYLKVCEEAARAAGAVLLDWADRFTVREKGPADLVTEADIASQGVIYERLRHAFPEHAILGEEAGETINPGAEFRWLVDPLDGTTNFAHRLPCYAVSIGLERAGQVLAGVIFNPASNECYTAAVGEGAFLNGERLRTSAITQLSSALVAASFPPRVARTSPEIRHFVEVLVAAQSVRRTGSAAINFCHLAAGRYDGYWATDTKAWDVAAGILIVREAGGIVTAIDGGEVNLDQPKFVAAATRELHAQLRERLNRDGRHSGAEPA